MEKSGVMPLGKIAAGTCQQVTRRTGIVGVVTEP
jgi:hypothetical protein